MKHIKNFENYINEELKILTGPSDKETDDEFKKLSKKEINNILRKKN